MSIERDHADYIIIGAGIAGASVAWWLAPQARVLVLEAESQPGYHSTGRSAAMFMESYGTAQVRALTLASRALFEAPPPEFGEHPLLVPRGALTVATHGQEAVLDREWAAMQATTAAARWLDAQEACALMPALRRERVLAAVYDAGAADMDVHAIHHGYLRGMRAHAGRLITNAPVRALTRDGGVWRVHAGGAGRSDLYSAPVVIDAAGAWADVVAALAGAAPLGLEPRRRSAFTFPPPQGLSCADWPMTAGVDEDWYVKPDAGLLLGSPANADPVAPQDVRPEEFDIALGIDRIEAMTTLKIRRPLSTWAGLRSFVADGDLVGGWDPEVAGFFWVAAQGGYGIQTSAAMGEACAALVRGEPLPQRLVGFGLTEANLSPARLARRVPAQS